MASVPYSASYSEPQRAFEALRAKRAFITGTTRYGRRPDWVTNAYECTGWGFILRYIQNKINASNEAAFRLPNGRRVLQWENSGKAIVQGVEGNLFVSLRDDLDWNTNLTYMIESKERKPATR